MVDMIQKILLGGMIACVLVIISSLVALCILKMQRGKLDDDMLRLELEIKYGSQGKRKVSK